MSTGFPEDPAKGRFREILGARGETRRRSGFTIVELLASTALLLGVLVLLVGTVDQTQRVWRRTSEKTTQFQSARAAFEAMTRRLSQATLNTYWRAFETDMENEQADFRFRRQSELQFLSGPAERIFGATPSLPGLAHPVLASYPTHAVFFQAPLGYTEEVDGSSVGSLQRFRKLDGLLTGCGYFIEYGPEPDRPEFLTRIPGIPDRYRFRLMEMTVPAERLTIFSRPKDTKGFNDPRIFDELHQFPYKGLIQKDGTPEPAWVRPLWLRDALLRVPTNGETEGSRFRFARTRAENIVALIILPKLAERDRVRIDEPELAPYYEYDSWRALVVGQGRVRDGSSFATVDNVARDNLLPPIVQVTMVAVDEASMDRMNLRVDNVPEWTSGLFKRARTEAEYHEDLQTLERGQLQKAQLNYRIFSADVLIRASKWSRDPANAQASQP